MHSGVGSGYPNTQLLSHCGTCLLQVRNGVKMGEGDGTVSLISLGAMCVEGWKRRRWNPAGINVTVVEVNITFFHCVLFSSF